MFKFITSFLYKKLGRLNLLRKILVKKNLGDSLGNGNVSPPNYSSLLLQTHEANDRLPSSSLFDL